MIRLSSIIDSVENKLNRAVSAASIVEELENKDIDYSCPNSVISSLSDEFISKLPIIIHKVISEETLIPSDVPILIEKKNYRVNGEVWVAVNMLLEKNMWKINKKPNA